MTPVDDLDQQLEQRFTQRAKQVEPTADPGPAILHRADRLGARRRRQRIGVATLAVVAVVALAVAGLRTSSGPTRLRTADDGTTSTTTPGCSVADVCQPASVSSISVAAPPPGYTLNSGSPPASLAGSQVVELTYAASDQTSTPPTLDTTLLTIQVTTSTESATAAVVQQAASWSAVTVGARTGRFESAVHTAGTTQVVVGTLQVQLSPTVVLHLTGEGLDEGQLVDVAASITVLP
jgi:hypothetical protein